MNDLVRFANSVEYTTGKKRGRHPVFNSNMFYPYKAERRLQAATKKEFETYILEAYEVAVVGETFTQDSLEDLSNLPERISEGFRQEISYAADSIAKKVSSNIANMSEMVVGKPYYPPTAKESLLKDWQANFQTLCKSAESDAKKEISSLVQQAKDEGWNRKQLERAVKKHLPEKYASRAALIARTESAKLNTQVTLSTYKEIGVEYYVWMAAMDERTRPEHAMMNGLICSATDPTVWYEENPEDPMHPIEHKRDDTMVHLHPGEDYQCRCTMVMWDPVIDGKYEVKEGEKPEEPEEEPENEPESRELEKANERIAKQEKELEKAENERKTVEKELAQEKSARKAAEKAQKSAEAKAEKQSAENERLLAEKEKAEEESRREARRREILQSANKRHAKRTEEQRYKIRVEHAQRQNKYEICNEIGIDIPKKGMTHEEADSGKVNPNYTLDRGFRINCQSCVPVYEFRKKYGVNATAIRCPSRGYSVPAMLARDTANAYRTVDGNRRELRTIPIQVGATLKEFIEKLKEIAKEAGDYALQMEWKRGRSGHIINFTKSTDGEIKFYDNQYSGSMFVGIDLDRFEKKYFEPARIQRWSTMRIDDLVYNKDVIKGILDPASVRLLKKKSR